MKRHIALTLLLLLLASCTAEAGIVPTASTAPTQTSSPIPQTATITPTPIPLTETLTPSPTPLPGKLVLPIDTLGNSIPWLPVDETARPTVHYVAFNTLHPPFNNALVRQAFAYAIDRQFIADMAEKYKVTNPNPATTLTPPETLGRDLYKEVGTVFDPQMAKEFLTEAGYTNPSVFPTVTIIVSAGGEKAPGARFNMATAMAGMWKTHLGVTVNVEAMKPLSFGERLRSNLPEMYWLGWVADYNDPDNFLRGIFRSDSQYNYGKFTSLDFDHLVDLAAESNNAAERQEEYILAERLLCETKAALIPLYHTR